MSLEIYFLVFSITAIIVIFGFQFINNTLLKKVPFRVYRSISLFSTPVALFFFILSLYCFVKLISNTVNFSTTSIPGVDAVTLEEIIADLDPVYSLAISIFLPCAFTIFIVVIQDLDNVVNGYKIGKKFDELDEKLLAKYYPDEKVKNLLQKIYDDLEDLKEKRYTTQSDSKFEQLSDYIKLHLNNLK